MLWLAQQCSAVALTVCRQAGIPSCPVLSQVRAAQVEQTQLSEKAAQADANAAKNMAAATEATDRILQDPGDDDR